MTRIHHKRNGRLWIYRRGQQRKGEALPRRFRNWRTILEKKLGVVVLYRTWGANTSGPVSAGSSLGMLAVDGDYCGRAIPEILQITPYLNGKECLPVTSVDEWGNTCIIKDAVNLRVVEKNRQRRSALEDMAWQDRQDSS